MSTHAMDAPAVPERPHRRGGFVVLGAGLILLGGGAVVAAVTTTLVTVAFLALLALAGGIAQAVHAFRYRKRGWRSFVPELLSGLLYVLVGALLLVHPLKGALALTLLIAAVMTTTGVARIAWALLTRLPGSGVGAAQGALTLLMGVLLWLGWPGTGVWAIGAFVGLDLLLDGCALVWAGVAGRAPGPAFVSP